VIYHDNKCIGCRYCQVACPFHAPTFQWDRPVPFIRKCTFCSDRVSQGIEPACVKACPTDALQFGEREALLAEARKRMAARPGKYVDHIYGEKEAGGTSWLYLSPVPFEMLGFIAYGAVKMGFPTIGPERVDKFASVAMGVVPAWILAASATLSGLYWFTRRREKGLQARKEGQAAHQEEA
jgi:formate dehydrogenase iron-sulfur subunit